MNQTTSMSHPTPPRRRQLRPSAGKSYKIQKKGRKRLRDHILDKATHSAEVITDDLHVSFAWVMPGGGSKNLRVGYSTGSDRRGSCWVTALIKQDRIQHFMLRSS